MRVPTIPGRPEESPLEFSLAETGLSLRTINTLEAAGIFTVEDLLNVSEQQLLGIKNFGEKTLKDIRRTLKDLGLIQNRSAQVAAQVAA